MGTTRKDNSFEQETSDLEVAGTRWILIGYYREIREKRVLRLADVDRWWNRLGGYLIVFALSIVQAYRFSISQVML